MSFTLFLFFFFSILSSGKVFSFWCISSANTQEREVVTNCRFSHNWAHDRIQHRRLELQLRWCDRQVNIICIIQVRRNAGVGLMRPLGREKGLSVSGSTGAQRAHIVCPASSGLLYCPPFCTPPSHSAAQPWTTKEEESGFSWMGQSVHAQDYVHALTFSHQRRGEQVSGCNCLEWARSV